MQLWRLIFKQYRSVLIWLTLISIASAFAGVGVIAYINDTLTQMSDNPWRVLLQLIGLLIILFILNFIAQYSLSYIGHKFVYEFRNTLIKRIMDTDIAVIERIGSSRLLASLSKDIDSIQSAFMDLPGFIQGAILSLGASAYLFYLAWDLFLVVIAIVVMIAIVGRQLVKRVYKHYRIVRNLEDNLYQDFESIIHGRKELSLNRQRAKLLYNQEFKTNAFAIRKHIVIGDTLHFTALNWIDTMLLASIGVVFFLANVVGWANNTTATTFAVTILFLKSPLVQSFSSIPTFLEAHVSFNKIKQLGLNEPQPDFAVLQTFKPWQTLLFKNICYHYQDEAGNISFAIGPIDFRLQRGEVVFLIGGNGSGKSTFAKLLTGLYRPTSGEVTLDNQIIDANDPIQYAHYRQYFSAVYTDLHLFKSLVGKADTLSEDEKQLTQEWLEILQMQDKIQLDDNHKVLNKELSQGQRKRLALLLAVVEQRELLLLDEWAADQDPQFRRTFYHEIIPRLKAMEKTLIIISHDDHYFEQADRLLQMKDGKLIELTGEERQAASRDAVAQLDQK
ncbi:multidrug ABC transporter permease/ATP-binding protein [Psychrobacter sp. I-STPA10]|uniref:multidrug ABC transporter permease/ATP-binding protein n=1 Tax=Psychrobacter sp. I-STPA10 TaxID=2585769 RepID=UPI001E501D0E|nr:multidrug ABC transporter permease/ATP-binding protein [Psychrobacter sp. I-STPA10]